MGEWSVKRLYRDSFSFRWSARFFVLSLIFTFLIFGYQEYTSGEQEHLSYEDTRQLMEESARISAQRVIDANVDEEVHKKTGYNLTEIQRIANEFKSKAKNDYDRGLAAYNLKEYNSAIYFFNSSLNYHSNATNEIFYIGTAYLKLGEYDSAKIWLNMCSDNFQCLDQISTVYALEGDLNRAIDYRNRSLSVLPNPGGFYNLGTLYALQGTNESCEKAIFYFDESLKFNDKAWEVITQHSTQIISGKTISKQEALLNKGYCLMNLNRLNESLLIFKEIKDQGRDDFEINYNLAINYFKLKDYNNARTYTVKFLNISQNIDNEEAKVLFHDCSPSEAELLRNT